VLLAVGLTLLWPGLPGSADTPAPQLVISQFKVTSSSGQFFTLYNTSDQALNMSNYQLEYFNNYDLTKATSSKLITLSGTLTAHSYYMVNDGSMSLCYQLTVDSESLDFSSTAGLVEVMAVSQASPGGMISSGLQDYVAWSKTAASGAQTLPTASTAFLVRQPLNTQNNPAITTPGSGNWQSVQPAATNNCQLVTTTTGTPTNVVAGPSQLLPSTEPPATIVDDSDGSTDNAMPTLPAADIGLMAPQITELLPNPAGTGNDATDEYIELYNPNPVSFDLSGFKLQSGMTSLHSYTFPGGTSLPPNSSTAYYATDTGLSLSNESGQVKLLDPLSNSLSATDPYTTAKDGLAWALAKGKWYWTTTQTPGAANIITQPPAAKKSAAGKSTAKKTSQKTATTKKAAATSTSTATAANTADTVSRTPIHIWALAAVAGLALLYGAYEYRTDLTNRLYQLRRYLAHRRADRA
jgi:hypothetical protein